MTQLKSTPLTRCAQVVSDIFSPIMIPAYMMAVALWMTPLILIPERARISAMVIIVLITAIIPTATIFTLIKLGKASDVSLSNPKERTTPYLITISCYIIAAFYLQYIHAPFWLPVFYYGAALASVIDTIITFYWKISAHTSAVGGLTAAVIWLTFARLLIFGPIFWITAAILIAGLVGSARLILNRHTTAQVFAGFVVGFLSVISLLIICSTIL